MYTLCFCFSRKKQSPGIPQHGAVRGQGGVKEGSGRGQGGVEEGSRGGEKVEMPLRRTIIKKRDITTHNGRNLCTHMCLHQDLCIQKCFCLLFKEKAKSGNPATWCKEGSRRGQGGVEEGSGRGQGGLRGGGEKVDMPLRRTIIKKRDIT